MEYNAIKLLIKLLDEDKTPAAPGFTLHVAHLANADALPMIEAARKKGAFPYGHALPFANSKASCGTFLWSAIQRMHLSLLAMHTEVLVA